MPTPQDFISKAAGEIGNYEDKYNDWYWGYRGPAWCAAFISWVSEQIGGCGFNKSAAVSGIVNQLQRIDDRDARPGDFVAFNWDGREYLSWMDHIGVVEWSNIDDNYNGLFGTIEGNTGNEPCRVLRMTRNNNAGYFTAFFRPVYDGAGVVTPPTNQDIPIEWPGSGVIYQVSTHAHGWLTSVNRVDDSEDGYAGYQNSPIDGIKAYRPDGAPVDIQVQTNQLGWLGWTRFTDSLWGSNSAGDGYSGNKGNGDYITAIKVNGASIRVSTTGGYFGWLVNGNTPEGDDFAGDPPSAITHVQMKL